VKNREVMPVGIVMERRRIDHPWQAYSWHVVSLLPGTTESSGWRILHDRHGSVRYHAATLNIELYPSDTGGYRHNLSQRVPCIYILLRPCADAADGRLQPVVATASSHDATDYLDSSENLVEGVPMPEAIVAWIGDYVARYHREVPFEKRKRKPHVQGKARGSDDGADDGAG
jgi:hypothetical protein